MKIYAIKKFMGGIVYRNGKPCIYFTKELAEKDRRSMPDSWTDYDHFEVTELDMATSEAELLFKRI